jgi:hypothetical protein
MWADMEVIMNKVESMSVIIIGTAPMQQVLPLATESQRIPKDVDGWRARQTLVEDAPTLLGLRCSEIKSTIVRTSKRARKQAFLSRSIHFKRTIPLYGRPIGVVDRRGRIDNLFKAWGCRLDMTFFTEFLSKESVIEKLQKAGETIGVGLWRAEYGGPFGTFRIADEDDHDWVGLQTEHGKSAQYAALLAPTLIAYPLEHHNVAA